MKLLLLFFCVAILANAHAMNERASKYYADCMAESGADVELIKRSKSGDFGFDDDKVKAMLFCSYKRLEIMRDDGTFNRDAPLKIFPKDKRDEAKAGFDKCMDDGGDGPEAAWRFSKCYVNNYPAATFEED